MNTVQTDVHCVGHRVKLTTPVAQVRGWDLRCRSWCSPAFPATSCGRPWRWSGWCHPLGSECLPPCTGWGRLWLGHTQTEHVRKSARAGQMGHFASADTKASLCCDYRRMEGDWLLIVKQRRRHLLYKTATKNQTNSSGKVKHRSRSRKGHRQINEERDEDGLSAITTSHLCLCVCFINCTYSHIFFSSFFFFLAADNVRRQTGCED